jgi:uncharacterized coiled-coil protein SlyX
MSPRDIAALFRVAPREPTQTLEQRVARLERRLAYAEELLDEGHHRIVELETVSDARRAAA